MIKAKILYITILISFCTLHLSAQDFKYAHPLYTDFEKGMQSVQKGDSLIGFELIQSAHVMFPLNEEIGFHYTKLLLELNKPNADKIAQQWLSTSKNEIYLSKIYFQLGIYFFNKKQDKESLNAFNHVSIDDLDNQQIIEMKFQQGYCYFKLGNWEQASKLLNNIRQVTNNKYFSDANYYSGFIALEKKDFKLALECFKICESDPDYSRLVPFYISQLYYFTGNVDAALKSCEKALQQKNQFYTTQLEQLMGHLLFEKKEYNRALPFLASYAAAQKNIETQDLYQLSFCYYENKDWDKAIEGFKKLANVDDSLGQNSMYLLATSYLKIQNIDGAKNAFLLCATKSENKSQKEIALFNYAKLAAETKEYNASINSFDKFFKQYPKSIYTEEAKNVWITVLTLSNNFQQALDAYNQILNPSNELLKIYPNILYGKATLLINDGKIENAYSTLNQLLHTPYNNKVLSSTLFWIGELSYKRGDLNTCIENLEKYLSDPIENGDVSVKHAKYTLAYAYIKNNNYQKALDNFTSIVNLQLDNVYETYQKDAYVRMGDCLMMLKQYKKALNIYQKVIDLNWSVTDYATLQKANILGGMGKPKEKIAILKDFEENYNKSTYLNDARLELADTYTNQEQFQLAIVPLTQIILDKEATEFKPIAYYKLGMVYYNLDKNDVAIQTFRELFSNFPKATETENATEIVRNIFVENQTPENFVQFMNEFGKPLSVNEQDSLVYRSCILKYDQQKYTEASHGFIKYLQSFPTGKYQLDAKYLLAEIAYSKEQYDSAAKYFALVADQAPNKYAERSVLLSARLHFFELKQYDKASHYFEQLNTIALQQENKNEAVKGLLRCQFQLGKWKEASLVATQILIDKNAAQDDLQMALMVQYHNLIESKDTSNAIQILSRLIKLSNSQITAEAHYLIASLQFEMSKYSIAEKTAFDVIKKQAAYPFWVTKAYILLGDIYVAQKDIFNATATYKSVFENAEIPALKNLAEQKLNALNAKQ